MDQLMKENTKWALKMVKVILNGKTATPMKDNSRTTTSREKVSTHGKMAAFLKVIG